VAGVKNGKLTKDEAMALHAKVKSIREEMQADVKSNGNGELTGDQYKQLNQEFDENSTAIHDEKTDGAAATPTAN
jgi:ribosome recycling factor